MSGVDDHETNTSLRRWDETYGRLDKQLCKGSPTAGWSKRRQHVLGEAVNVLVAAFSERVLAAGLRWWWGFSCSC